MSGLHLTVIGYAAMILAAVLACFEIFWCLPVGVIGGVMFLYGSWREQRAHTRLPTHNEEK